MDKISENGIKSLLSKNLCEFINVNITDITESTNSDVKSVARSGEKEGYLLIAESQTGGRGRMGRSFFSPDDTGIYMSLLLRPEILPEDVTTITSVAAVAVCEALEKIAFPQIKPQIKWVNDIYINGKKVCGILTEGCFKSTSKTDYAVLGIGINFYEPENGFPDELSNIAGAVFKEKKENLKNQFVAYFLNSFFSYYNNLNENNYIEEYKKRCFILGRNIMVISKDKEIPARALDIDEKCGLAVEYENGEKTVISTGEISVKPM